MTFVGFLIKRHRLLWMSACLFCSRYAFLETLGRELPFQPYNFTMLSGNTDLMNYADNDWTCNRRCSREKLTPGWLLITHNRCVSHFCQCQSISYVICAYFHLTSTSHIIWDIIHDCTHTHILVFRCPTMNTLFSALTTHYNHLIKL